MFWEDLHVRYRSVVKQRGLSPRTAKTYGHWIERFVRFYAGVDLLDLGGPEVAAFVNHLAVRRGISASTYSQALSALLFLYRHVLQVDMPWIDGIERPARKPRIPVVLRKREVQLVMQQLHGVPRLMANLMYGSGLRLSECASLRVKDIGFDARSLLVREGKGNRDRRTLLAETTIPALEAQMRHAHAQHQFDLREGAGSPTFHRVVD
jgi:site-specific recombinase XerD